MEKKAIPLDKVNKHTYAGETLYIGTKHNKAVVLAPLFNALGMRCETVAIDTDEFGTFSGEVERSGSVKETLRKKIQAVLKVYPKANFILASEGSFGPHPFIGFLQSNYEALMFFDKEANQEIFCEEIFLETNNEEIEVESSDIQPNFLERVQFPSHGLIVHTKDTPAKIFKGITGLVELKQAIESAFLNTSESKVVVTTDMRANFNPTRMNNIKKTGEKLLELLNSLCPKCSANGFGPQKAIQGLRCSECGMPTSATEALLFTCYTCKYEEIRKSVDQEMLASPDICDFCNP
jgi:hypothetical protein